MVRRRQMLDEGVPERGPVKYTEKVKIDFHDLHKNWQEQADLYGECSEAYAEAIRKVDKIKERLSVRESRLDAEIRLDPSTYGLNKVTDTAIKSIINLDDACIEMRKELIQATYEKNILSAGERALQQRKTSLEWISRLWISNYFAVPNISRDVPKEIVDRCTQEMYNKALDSSNLRDKLTKEKED